MKKTETINYYTSTAQYFDFGKFRSRATIKVDSKFWSEYCDARVKYEVMHAELIQKTFEKR